MVGSEPRVARAPGGGPALRRGAGGGGSGERAHVHADDDVRAGTDAADGGARDGGDPRILGRTPRQLLPARGEDGGGAGAGPSGIRGVRGGGVLSGGRGNGGGRVVGAPVRSG